MRRLKVVYMQEDKSVIDIDLELDDKIRAFFKSQGFVLTGQGTNLLTQERDISFVEMAPDEEPF